MWQRTGSRAQAPEHRLQSPGYRAQATEPRLQRTGSRAQATEPRLQSTGYRAQATEHMLQPPSCSGPVVPNQPLHASPSTNHDLSSPSSVH
ncbi:unnamed protein product [Boreogadus saida]